ncbi:MAG: group II truncated hemoglobin [Gammaproteobacteria bacterium]|nr:group II truncated hemoglobin [Gammaproteobacteria bacterium]
MSGAEQSAYAALGGEGGVRRLVDRFYELMDQLPRARAIRALHPADLRSSRDRLFKFLSGWLGGPPLYMEQYGHPRLRARHLPFPIGEDERDAWLMCMAQALAESGIDEPLRDHLFHAMSQLADHMRNQ